MTSNLNENIIESEFQNQQQTLEEKQEDQTKKKSFIQKFFFSDF